MHSSWMTKHSKTYATPKEEASRFEVFKNNLEYILEHNVKFSMDKSSFTMSMNAHGDLTSEEWKVVKLNFKPSPKKTTLSFDSLSSVHSAPLIKGIGAPPSLDDWRAKGAVTQVKKIKVNVDLA